MRGPDHRHRSLPSPLRQDAEALGARASAGTPPSLSGRVPPGSDRLHPRRQHRPLHRTPPRTHGLDRRRHCRAGRRLPSYTQRKEEQPCGPSPASASGRSCPRASATPSPRRSSGPSRRSWNMNGSTKILPTHRQRQAVVYLRQSTPKQVLKNCESAINQRALRGRLLELGWRKDQIVLIDDDQARSARQVAGREGFQRLVADVSLRKVGLIIGTEVARLSRNCADWHRLLELCALFDTLIADADGVYNPRDFNDLLLLGLKGTLSEAELHSLRLRLDAGRLSKAGRGELVQHLPTGLVRDADGVAHLDPDESVRDRIRLVFAKFRELGSAQKVLRYLVANGLKLPRRQTSGLYAGVVLWKEPNSHALVSLLKNPAYAGAFAYGRRVTDPARQVPGRPATGTVRQPRDRWQALVKDVYPAYIRSCSKIIFP